MTERVVAKFGGTSNRNAEAVALCAEQAADYQILVTSAPGALAPEIPIDFDYPGSVPEDTLRSKVTDQLLEAHATYREEPDRFAVLCDSVTARFGGIVDGCDTKELQGEWVRAIPAKIETAVQDGKDYASMLGERLQAEIYEAMGRETLDPGRAGLSLAGDTDQMKTAWRTYMRQAADPGGRYIMRGNTYGDGNRAYTYSRGGSDTSSAWAAYGFEADWYLNMTDTPGLSANPRLIPRERLRVVGHLVYPAGRGLGQYGTGLLHAQAIVPLEGSGIVTRIGSTFDHEGSYTTYSDKIDDPNQAQAGKVQAISLIHNVGVISVHEPGMREDQGRVAELEKALKPKDLNVPDSEKVTIVDVTSYGIDTQLFIVDGGSLERARELLQAKARSTNDIAVFAGSVVTLVGYKLSDTELDTRLKLRDEIGLDDSSRIPVEQRLEAEHSLGFIVPQDRAVEVVDRAHALLIESQ